MKQVNRKRERGAALLALLAVIMLGASWLLVSKLNAESGLAQAAYKERNAAVLNRAKQALIGYVAAQAVKTAEPNPGALPCPEAAGYFDSTTQDGQAAILAITQFAELVFGIIPFVPDTLPDNWRDILRAWLLGQPLAGLAGGDPSNMMQFVEGGLVYRLPWAMEAIRVRGVANADTIAPFGLALDDFELGLAVPAVETGAMNRSASLLIQAGFSSRLAAIKAVGDTAATFVTIAELQAWLDGEVVAAFSQMPNWPTAATAGLWNAFRTGFVPAEKRIWIERRYWAWVQWRPGVLTAAGSPLRLRASGGQRLVLAPDGTVLGDLQAVLNPDRRGLLRAVVSTEANKVDIFYHGPDDLWLS